MLAIIGGSGLDQMPGLTIEHQRDVSTPYQSAPVKLLVGKLSGSAKTICFMPRHGEQHAVPPHRINYRANLYALHVLGATGVLAVNAVGGITEEMGPGVIAIPDQIIDYTWGRDHTFFDGSKTDLQSSEKFSDTVAHIDFTDPYSAGLRELLIDSAASLGIGVLDKGTYAATQGPRLESAAEVQRMRRDGADLVGMTGMPEAALARELGLPYACIALSVNWAAGIDDGVITMEGILQVLSQGMGDIQRILTVAVSGN